MFGGAVDAGSGRPRGTVVTQEWTCAICTLDNNFCDAQCAVCGADRYVRIPSNQLNLSPPPRLPSSSSFSVLYDASFNEDSDSGSDDNCRGAHPDLDGRHRDAQFATKTEFQMIASQIACDPHFTLRTFHTLRSVARRLLLDDPRYRRLDSANKKVREKLLRFDGVIDFLELLGFRADEYGTKLICTHPLPPSCTEDAIDVLNMYLNERPSLLPPNDNDSKERAEEEREEQQHPLDANLTRASAPNEDDDRLRRSGSDHKVDTDQFTLEQIVLWVTQPQQNDRENSDVLVLCYSTLAPPQTLVRALRDRYFSVPIPSDCPPENEEEFVRTEQRPVQLKVANMLKGWLRSYWREDFAANEEAQQAVASFLHEMQSQQDCFNQSLADAVIKLFNRVKKETIEDTSLVYLYRNVPSLDEDSVTRLIGNQSSAQLAEQITLMDFHIFSSIRKRECLGQAWKQKNGAELAPNVLAMIEQWNMFSKWVQIQILNQKNLKNRARALKRIIKLGERFCALQNYNSLCAVFSALNSTCIHRLKSAWERVPTRRQKSFKDFQVLFAPEKNHKNLRILLRHAAGPTVPHIGLFLQDLVSIDEGNKTHRKIDLHPNEKTEIFNFDKARRSAERIKTMVLHQQRRYPMESDIRVQKILYDEMMGLRDTTEDAIWELSRLAEAADSRAAQSWI